MVCRTLAAQRRTSNRECCVAMSRSEGNPRLIPTEKTSRTMPATSAARVVIITMRKRFFAFCRSKSPGRSTRDTSVGMHVAAATESVRTSACSRVPRKSCRTKYRSQNKKSAAGTVQYARTAATTISSIENGERWSRDHRKCQRTKPIRYHGPSRSSVCPSGNTAGSAAMLPHSRSSRKWKRT